MDLKALNPTLFASYEQAKAYPPDEFGARWKEVGSDEAEQFETETGLSLPSDYLDFVREFGEFTIWTEGFGKLYTRVTWQTGKSGDAEIGKIAGPVGILETRQSYLSAGSGARIPKYLVPVTFDSGYGHVMLDLSKEGFGKVRYLQVKTKAFGTDGYGWDQVGSVAESFAEFVRRIDSKKGLAKSFGPPKKG
ncbi:SMI1/KNR4 family protein [Agrobacterium cavarae]|uniref:SMI1/KNR4 family protein n=1 Tax=Agrobacterium cavarae TaxID=2528239 RepID=UPI002FDAA6E9